MYDVISIGSSVIDSFIKSKAFEIKKTDQGNFLCQSYGAKIDVDEYIVRTGGGGSNTAVGFARMGFRTAIISELGQDVWSKIILEELHNEIVDTKFVITEKNEETGGSIILLGNDGSRTILVHRGASAQLDPKDIPENIISISKWVHLSSLSGQKETLKFIFKLIKNSNAKLSWNPGNKELQLLLDYQESDFLDFPVDILILNKHEWDSIRIKQQEILKVVPHVVVTNGKLGGEVYISGKPQIRFMSDAEGVVDETGAGDSFAVGYITAQIKGKTIEEACNWGKKNARSVIAQIGAKPGLLTINQIESHNS